MSDIQNKVIEAALRKMFSRGYLDICTIDKCLKLQGMPQSGKAYDMLHALHCVHFADMDRDLARAAQGMIAEVLGMVAEFVEPEPEPEPQPRRGLLELFRK